MNKIKVKLSYWTFPDGDDFKEIEVFKKALSEEYDTEIESKPTDALGGGLYEFVLEIVNNVDFADIASGYIEDALKVGVGFFCKPIFNKIKELFKKNKHFKPDIAEAKFIFNDIEIIIYPTYTNSIDEVINEVLKKLSLNFLEIKDKIENKIESIHIPIFNQVDYYELCAYRVKLNVDENITSFSKKDYFKYWGIKCDKKTDFVYELENESLLKTRFYTQSEYDILWNKNHKSKI